MYGAYYRCNRLTGSPVCGNSVVNMANTYRDCPNLYGDFYVNSDKITNAKNCFYGRNNKNTLNILVNFGTNSNTSFYNSGTYIYNNV